MQGLGIVVLLLVAGCYAPQAAEGAPCVTSDDCPSPQRCVLGQCSLSDRDAATPLPKDAAIDAPMQPTDATPLSCGLNGFTCNGGLTISTCAQRCWATCDQLITRSAAIAKCAAWQGTLAEIDSAAEQACVAGNVDVDTWIGLSQPVNQSSVSAGWTWNAMRALGYTNWQVGAPNDIDGVENNVEQCGEMQASGAWDDEDCAVLAGVACERPIN